MPKTKPATLIWAFILLGGCAGGSEDESASSEPQDVQVQESDALASDEPLLSELAERGKTAFLKCQSCHTVGQGGRHMVGPNLYGFYGEAAGTRDGFVYSDALKASDVIWDDANLDAWLEKPSSFIPGNKMIYVGSPDADERAALIAYMKEVTQ